jgi:NAD(P)-dependent dehydrogenase (short-subunit alcohol dehydrogenase family)
VRPRAREEDRKAEGRRHGRTVYSASKQAVEGLTKSMAIELGPRQIRGNSIGPTFIKTPLTEDTRRSSETSLD